MLAIGLAGAGFVSLDLALVPAIAAYWNYLPCTVRLPASPPVFACSDSELWQSAVEEAEQERTEITEESFQAVRRCKRFYWPFRCLYLGLRPANSLSVVSVSSC